MRLLVLGDYISDVYTFGEAMRLCPEAPVPVIIRKSGTKTAGGAGLVDRQLRELGSDVLFSFGSVSRKERIYAGNHLVCRIDEDSHDVAPLKFSDWVLACDAYVIADYSKGAMTQELAEQIVATGKPCFVDAKNHWPWYAGKNVTIFPNHREATPVKEMPPNFVISHAADYGCIVSKLGKDGAMLVNDESITRIDATTSEVIDVCGAGDIFMASFVYAWTLQLKSEDCLRFANELAGESCRHIGTFVVPREFAQAVLCKIRSSATSPQLTPDLQTYSNSPEHLRTQPQDHSTSAPSGGETIGSLPVSSEWDRAVPEVDPDNSVAAQTLPQLPLSPIESSDTLSPEDQERLDRLSNDLARRGAQILNSIVTEHQYERTPALDQVLKPGKS